MDQILKMITRALKKTSATTVVFLAILSVGIGLTIYVLGLNSRIFEAFNNAIPLIIGLFAVFLTLLSYLKTNKQRHTFYDRAHQLFYAEREDEL
jgi:hypothetical protein